MNKLSKFFLAAALAFGMAQAHAGYIDLSQVPMDVSATLDSAGSYDFERLIVTDGASLGQAGNGFSDRYSFLLNSSYQAVALMTSLLHTDGSGLVITGFNLRTAVGTLVYEGAVNSDLFAPDEQGWMFEGDKALSSGSYFLEVNGYATAVNASYGGTLAVSAVPEPGSLALMLGGMAVLGLALRRRA